MYDIEKKFEYQSAKEMANAWKFRFDGLHNKLPGELCELFFSYWPEMGKYREQLNQELSELAVYSCHEAYLSLMTANEYLRLGLPVEGDQSLPRKKSRKKEENKLNKLFKKFPCLNDEEFTRRYWEDFELGEKVDNFYFQVHRKIKETLVEFYIESINCLESEQLRFLDCQLYYIASFPFSEGALNFKYRIEEAQNIESNSMPTQELTSKKAIEPTI